MNEGEIKVKTFIGPITKNVYTKTVYPGNPGLVAAKVTAELTPEQRQKIYEQKLEKERKKGFPFLPGPAGTSPYHPRRIEDGGKFMRLKRR